MTFQPTFRILAASIALALAGATHAQTPPAPSTAPAPAATTAPAPDAASKAGASTSTTTKDRASRRATTPTGNAALPKGTPGIAAVPGAAPPGGAQAAKPQRAERRPNDTGGSGRQLQNAYADLMTPEEMAAHRAKVKQTKTYAECKSLFEATGKDMEARAKSQNKTVKANPTEICDRAKERGRLTG